MLKWLVGGLLGMTAFAGAANAQTCPAYTYSFTTGTTAVASQVMQDFNDVRNCANNNLVASSGGTLTNGTLSGTTTLPGGGSITNFGIVAPNNVWAVRNTAPALILKDTSQGLDSKIWDIETNSSILALRVVNDAYTTVTPWVQVTRSGMTISSVQFPNGAVQFSGVATTASAANAFLDAGNGNNLLRSTSSIRYKRDIRPVGYEEARKVLELTPVSFHSKSPADDPNRVFEGLTAEEVARQLPQFVNYITDTDGNTVPDGVQYDRIAAVALLGVVKQQQKEIEALRSCRLWCLVEEAIGFRPVP